MASKAAVAKEATTGKKKTKFTLTRENYEKFDYPEDSLGGLRCCAFVEYSGLDDLETVEDFIALRRVASGNDLDEISEAFDLSLSHGSDTDGMVLVTTANQQSKHELLRAAGFVEFTSFTRKNPTRTIKLWGARTLPTGKFIEPKLGVEEVTI